MFMFDRPVVVDVELLDLYCKLYHQGNGMERLTTFIPHSVFGYISIPVLGR